MIEKVKYLNCVIVTYCHMHDSPVDTTDHTVV